MRIGPKYKIAKRLGAPIFEKTQTQKFALSQTKKTANRSGKRRSQTTSYGMQMKEKQKARFTYLLTEKQFSKYARQTLEKKASNKPGFLFELLENRLDSVIFKSGFATTRSGARQIVSHGHMLVNKKRVTIPSYNLKKGDKISLRPQSQGKGVFAKLDERLKDHNTPNWMKFDKEKKEIEISGKPDLSKEDNLFDLNTVLEFYNR